MPGCLASRSCCLCMQCQQLVCSTYSRPGVHRHPEWLLGRPGLSSQQPENGQQCPQWHPSRLLVDCLGEHQRCLPALHWPAEHASTAVGHPGMQMAVVPGSLQEGSLAIKRCPCSSTMNSACHAMMLVIMDFCSGMNIVSKTQMACSEACTRSEGPNACNFYP